MWAHETPGSMVSSVSKSRIKECILEKASKKPETGNDNSRDRRNETEVGGSG